MTLTPVETVAFKATDYPIAVAEVPQASEMLDRLLSAKQKDELVDCLAFQPDVGEPLGDTSVVRTNVFEFEISNGCNEVTIVYFFHDLNMPLFILAAYEGGEVPAMSSKEETKMNTLAAEIVQEYRKSAEQRALGANA